MMLLQWGCNICRLCSAGRKTITLSKTLACNCNSLWHTLYKYLMHVDIEVVLTMPRILYLLSQTCKHPALRFSLAAHLAKRRGEHTSSILRSLFTAGLRPSLTQGKVRVVIIIYIHFLDLSKQKLYISALASMEPRLPSCMKTRALFSFEVAIS